MSSATKVTVKLCRLCANIAEETITHNLFDKSNQIVIQQIKELTGLTIRDMPRQMLPRYFCTKCKDELTRAWEFRRQIIKTQDYFKSNDYKSKLETSVEKDLKPTFMFVPMKDYEMNETLEANSYSDDSNVIPRNEILTAAECVEAVIKEEKTVNKTKNTNKRKTRKKPTDNLGEENSFEKIKVENISVVDKKENDVSSEDNFQTSVDCTDNYFDNDTSDDNHEDPDFVTKYEPYSEDSSSENNEDQGDPDFVTKLDKPKRERSKDSIEKAEPDILKDRQFCCHLCQHPIENLICLKIHFQKQHKGEKFKCDLCDERCTTIKSLVRHFRFHRGEKAFKCHYCELTFQYSTGRCRHERRAHSKDCPFLCVICGKKFITNEMGRKHMTVHTKERAFHCTVCKAAFLTKTHLRTHYRSMTHKNNAEKLNQTVPTFEVDKSAEQNLNVQNFFASTI